MSTGWYKLRKPIMSAGGHVSVSSCRPMSIAFSCHAKASPNGGNRVYLRYFIYSE